MSTRLFCNFKRCIVDIYIYIKVLWVEYSFLIRFMFHTCEGI